MRQNRELDYVLLYVGVPRELHKGREIRPGIVQVQRCRYSPVFRRHGVGSFRGNHKRNGPHGERGFRGSFRGALRRSFPAHSF